MKFLSYIPKYFNKSKKSKNWFESKPATVNLFTAILTVSIIGFGYRYSQQGLDINQKQFDLAEKQFVEMKKHQAEADSLNRKKDIAESNRNHFLDSIQIQKLTNLITQSKTINDELKYQQRAFEFDTQRNYPFLRLSNVKIDTNGNHLTLQIGFSNIGDRLIYTNNFFFAIFNPTNGYFYHSETTLIYPFEPNSNTFISISGISKDSIPDNTTLYYYDFYNKGSTPQKDYDSWFYVKIPLSCFNSSPQTFVLGLLNYYEFETFKSRLTAFVEEKKLKNKELPNLKNQNEYNHKNYPEIHNRSNRSIKGIKKTGWKEIDVEHGGDTSDMPIKKDSIKKTP